MNTLLNIWLLLLLTGTPTPTPPPAENWVEIPDEKFVAYLKEKIPAAFSGNKMNTRSAEVLRLNRINVLNRKITDFTGIEYFENLEEFNCTYNLAARLDLSKNKKLKYLVCWENRLTELDLSGNPELLVLNCGDNQITRLNVSKNRRLKQLHCEHNALPELDLSANPDLETLYLNSNKLRKIDLSRNTRLIALETWGNPLSTVSASAALVDIKDDALLRVLRERIPNAVAGEKLNIAHPNVTELKYLDVSSAGIQNATVLRYFRSLEKLDCRNNRIVSLDLSENVHLTALLSEGNPLESLDLRGMRHITELSDLSSLRELNIHAVLRTAGDIVNLKTKKGDKIRVSVYGSSYGATDYRLINGNDAFHPMDKKY